MRPSRTEQRSNLTTFSIIILAQIGTQILTNIIKKIAGIQPKVPIAFNLAEKLAGVQPRVRQDSAVSGLISS